MTMLEGRARLGPAAWLKTTSVAAALTLGLVSSAAAQGTFNFAMTDEPPHLDVQVTTATLTTLVNMHILETLYTFNGNLEPVPLLAESETVSDDGKTIVIKLREGVPFHNGEEMMADDVVASLNRWGALWRPRQGALRPYRERRGDRRSRGHDHVQGRVRSVEEPARVQQWRRRRSCRPRSSARRPPSRWRPSRSSAPARSASANGARTATSRWCGSTTTRSRPARSTAGPARGTSPSMRSTSSRCRTSAPG